jgi:hypothetical protein
VAGARLRRALYRSRQVWHALRPRLDPAALALPPRLLSEGEQQLFFAMEKRDQRHALEVAGRLLDQGIDDRELLAAALLHDCGKGAVPVWLRIANVLSPGFVRSSGRPAIGGWRGAAYRLAHHAATGAQSAERAGAGPTTVRLIGGHALPEEQPRLRLLIAADDAS